MNLHRDEVTPIPKPTRPWRCMRDNPTCARVDPCPSCRGRRNRLNGLRKQREAKRLLGVPANRFHGQDGNEENWRDAVLRHEVKSGQDARVVGTRFTNALRQADANRAIGDTRPAAVTFMPPGWGKRGVVCIDTETWRLTVRPALDDYWSAP